MDLAEAQRKGVLYHVGHGPEVVGADADEVREREAGHVDDHDDAGNLTSQGAHFKEGLEKELLIQCLSDIVKDQG